MEQRLSGRSEQGLVAEVIVKDELDVAILENVSMAGDRFERMLKVLAGGEPIAAPA
jgi:hypothetical protein